MAFLGVWRRPIDIRQLKRNRRRTPNRLPPFINKCKSSHKRFADRFGLVVVAHYKRRLAARARPGGRRSHCSWALLTRAAAAAAAAAAALRRSRDASLALRRHPTTHTRLVFRTLRCAVASRRVGGSDVNGRRVCVVRRGSLAHHSRMCARDRRPSSRSGFLRRSGRTEPAYELNYVTISKKKPVPTAQ